MSTFTEGSVLSSVLLPLINVNKIVNLNSVVWSFIMWCHSALDQKWVQRNVHLLVPHSIFCVYEVYWQFLCSSISETKLTCLSNSTDHWDWLGSTIPVGDMELVTSWGACTTKYREKCINDLTDFMLKWNLDYMVHVEVPSDEKANEITKCISNSAFMNGSHVQLS